MTDILNTGKSALFAFQKALATTSHNISNVNTEGFSRQRVDLEAIPGDGQSALYIGSGVRVSDVRRVNDEFASARVFSATSAHAQQNTHYQMASRLDNLMASDGISIAPTLDTFFNAIQDANIDPSSSATREVVLQSAEQLANRFQSLQNQLDDTQSEINERTVESVKMVAEYAESIAAINNTIVGIQGSLRSQQANDLLDQRDQLITKLSEHIDISTVNQGNGSLDVYIGKGLSLVSSGVAQSFSTVRDSLYPERLQIQIGEGVSAVSVDTNLQGGVIGGLNTFATETLHPAMQQLGRLSLSLADQLNEQHTRGVDIDGVPGGQLFGVADPQSFASSDNIGTATISGRISDTSELVATDYVLRFDGANFTATRTADGSQVTGSAPLAIDGLNLSLSGTPAAGDSFIVSAVSRAAGSMEALIGDPNKLALASQLNTNSELQNIGESRISDAQVIDAEAISLTVPIDIRFSSSSRYDLVDATTGTVVSGNNIYVEGQDIDFNGWRVSISGNAIAGDTHNIAPSSNAKGNNGNGLSLSALQNATNIDGIQSFNDAYGAMVSRVGSQTSTAASLTESLESLRSNAVDRQQASQGVNLDEEAINLTRYQQAYQASAQIISTADEMFQTILGAIR